MAERTEIASEINALAVHCRPPLMEVDQRASWLRDWCSDLAEFDIEAVRGACREWRQSGSAKFPTPGQLLPMVRKRGDGEKREAGINEPWRELSDAEYERLTLSEKVRHHRILAAEARRKAGPMWKAPPGGGDLKRPVSGHVSAEDMPASWLSWTRKAEGHEAEAAFLAGKLRQARVGS